jgi:hypothetical protein
VLIWSTGATSAAEREHAVKSLLDGNCRYFVCGGDDADAWELEADDAFLALTLQDPSYEERFVMTTAHGGEPVEEVVRFFIHNTRFEQHDFDQFLALIVGSDAAVERRIIAAVREELPHLPPA